MNSTASTTTPAAAPIDVDTDVAACACHLYDAECALHAAHQSGVEPWIAAATERLHEAVVAYRSAVAAVRADPTHRQGTQS